MKKNNPNIRALKMLIRFNPRYFPLFTLYTLVWRVSPFFNLWLSADIVTALYDGADKTRIWTLVILALSGNLLIALLSAILRRIAGHEYAILFQRERAAFLQKTLSLDYDKLEDPEIRTLRRTITENSYIKSNGIHRLRWSIETIISSVILSAMSAVFFIDMMIQISTAPFEPMSIVYLVGIIILLIGIIWYGFYSNRKMSVYEDHVNKALMDENRISTGMPRNNRDIRLYKQYIYCEKVTEQLLTDTRRAYFDVNNLDFKLQIPSQLLLFILRAFLYLLVCLYCTAQVFPIGNVIKYVGYLENFIYSVTAIFGAVTNIRANTPFIETYLSFFDISNDMYQGSLTTEKRVDRHYEVEFRNVSFKYPGRENYAIRNLSIKFQVGSRLAVVGMNGSGKTTFIKLLCRLYDPTEGVILLNGIDIRQYNYADYLSVFSVVFQDFRLFSFPLAQNVAAAETYDEGLVTACLEKAGFGVRLSTMPDGIHTPLYKDFETTGVEVSGGEAQKIALARALYKDAPFIILDEPTAALDPIAEAEIYSKFNDIAGDKTAIYISHRLSSCKFCDEIAVFHEGQVIQKGSHAELLADESGKYFELWNAQAQYYTEQEAT